MTTEIVHSSHYSSSNFDRKMYYHHFAKMFYKYYEVRARIDNIYIKKVNSILSRIPAEQLDNETDYTWKIQGL